MINLSMELIVLNLIEPVRLMDVFVDESGDLGFSSKSSNYFVAAYVMPRKSISIKSSLSRLLRKMHKNKRYSGSELKFSDTNRQTRIFVLDSLMRLEWASGVIVLEKRKVKPELRTRVNILYNYCIIHNIFRNLLISLEPADDINIYVDKSLSVVNRNAFDSYARDKASYVWNVELNRFPPLRSGQVSLSHEDSFNDPCLQLADFIAGATFQKYERANDEYYRVIESRITSFNYFW